MKNKLVSISLVAIVLLGTLSWMTTINSPTTALADNNAAQPAQLPAGAGSPGMYIQFDEPTHNLDQAHGYPAAGGHSRYGWDIIEPTDDQYRFEEEILSWAEQEVARGKKLGIGFVTYNGPPPYEGITIPSWVWTRDPNVRFYHNGRHLLNYLNRTYVDEYAEMIQAFAQWVANTPVVRDNLAWVETGTGLWAENQPVHKNIGDPNSDWNYYVKSAPNPEGGNGWSSQHWINHVNEVSLFYRQAFNNVGLGHIPIFTNIAPTFRNGWERDAIVDYGASINVGIKHAGLREDHENAGPSYGPIMKWHDSGTKIPICWEVYGPDTTFGPAATEWYWTVLTGLNWHPDYFLTTRGSFTYSSHLPHTELAHRYSGVTKANTPDVWVAMRETFQVGRWFYPYYGDYQFWLYRNDYNGGHTVTETNRSELSGMTNRVGQSVYNPNLGTSKEGWSTRRTSQGDGNPYMWFDIDDGYIYGGPTEATITVIYLDFGSDRWTLRYDSTSGLKDATPEGSSNSWVQKQNSGQWRTATFKITDGRLQNNLPGGHDFRIDCVSDGDEWIHMIKVAKGTSSAPPTPTPTHVPSPTPTPTQPTGHSVDVPLYTGSNWVAYGGARKTVADALSSIAGKYSKVLYMTYEYDDSQGRYMVVWKEYRPDLPPQFSTLTHLDPWQAYLILATEECTWTWTPNQ